MTRRGDTLTYASMALVPAAFAGTVFALATGFYDWRIYVMGVARFVLWACLMASISMALSVRGAYTWRAWLLVAALALGAAWCGYDWGRP